VLLTDTPRVLPQLQKNVTSNLAGLTLKHPFSIEALTWGKTELAKFQPPFDIILAADVIYSKKVVLPLLRTAHKLAGEHTLFLLAFETHDVDAAEAFWANVNDYFEWERIPSSDLDSFYHDSKIETLLLKKKRSTNQQPQQELQPQENQKEDSDYSWDYSDDSESSYESD